MRIIIANVCETKAFSTTYFVLRISLEMGQCVKAGSSKLIETDENCAMNALKTIL